LERISLLEVEPEFGSALGREQREAAEIGLQAPIVALAPGVWEPPTEAEADGFGYLVVEGMLMRKVVIEGGRSIELLATGDCLLPWREEPASFSRAEWQVVDRSRLAVLDLRPGSVISRWPAIAATIAGRAIDRSRRFALQSAIMSIVGIEDRLHALLWGLAERWGEVVRGGTLLEINVPQVVLAEMVGARRPTVSLALGSLREKGLVEADRSGRWLLRGGPPAPATE
jgi:CRP/FNR family transcriptional regulator, cyclic AMP receptor protein